MYLSHQFFNRVFRLLFNLLQGCFPKSWKVCSQVSWWCGRNESFGKPREVSRCTTLATLKREPYDQNLTYWNRLVLTLNDLMEPGYRIGYVNIGYTEAWPCSQQYFLNAPEFPSDTLLRYAKAWTLSIGIETAGIGVVLMKISITFKEATLRCRLQFIWLRSGVNFRLRWELSLKTSWKLGFCWME